MHSIKEFTDEQIKNVRNIPMIDFLGKYAGLTFHEHAGYYRCIEHDSLVIALDNIKWWWNSRNISGIGAIDYLTRIDGITFRQAMQILEGYADISNTVRMCDSTGAFFSLPAKAQDNKRVYVYLCKTRSISSDIVTNLMHDKFLFQDVNGNCVFVGYDADGIARYAALRGTLSEHRFCKESVGSDKRYSFRFGNCESDTVYVFESAIDAMSYATLYPNDWQDRAYLSLGGTSDVALTEYLKMYLHTQKIVLCLDSDAAGQTARFKLKQTYSALQYTIQAEFPAFKDWNEDLTYKRKKIRK